MSSIAIASTRLRAQPTGAGSPELQSAEAARVCLSMLQHHSHSFSLAALLLPRAQRREIAALYAWCRRADDAVDVPGNETTANAVTRLERELESVYRGEPQNDLVLAAFQRVVLDRRIPSAYPRALLRGLAMDVAHERYRTVDELLVYCFNVAGTVGLMSCHVLGLSDVRALKHAAHLGIAMQLTNISRDVLEDWQRGRCYLPEQLLAVPAAHEVAASGQPPVVAAVANAVNELLELAEGYYRSADLGLRALPWRAAVAVRAARLVYAAIGRRIIATGCNVLRGRTVLSRARKIASLALAAMRSIFELPARWFWSRRPAALPTTRLHDVIRL